MAFRQRNIRKKAAASFNDSGDEQDGDDDGIAIAHARASKPPKSKAPSVKQTAKKSGLLSFDEDEGEGSIKIKKKSSKSSLRSKAPALQLDDDSAPIYTQRSAPGEYTGDKLTALQKQTPVIKATTKKSNGADVSQRAEEPIIKLSGSFKPASAPKDDRFEVSATGIVPDPDEMPLPPPPRPPSREMSEDAGATSSQGRRSSRRDDITNDKAAMSSDVSDGAMRSGGHASGYGEDDEDDDFHIPDADTIRRAKEKRERLRSAHLAPDYIPMGGVQALTSRDYKSKEDATRVGDDEDSDDDVRDDDDMRIAFHAAPSAAAAAAVQPSASSRRAAPSTKIDRNKFAAVAYDDDDVDDAIGDAAALKLPVAKAATITAQQMGSRTAMEKINNAAADVVKAMQAAFQSMQSTQAHLNKTLARTNDNLADSMASVTRLERELSNASDKFASLQQFKLYIRDLCDMFQDKAAWVEELEDAMMALVAERSDDINAAQQQHDREHYSFGEAAASAALKVLSRKDGSRTAATTAAEAAVEKLERQLKEAMPAEVDEFGRDLNMQKRAEFERRCADRRACASQVADDMVRDGLDGVLSTLLSMTSSSEDESELRRYAIKRDEILQVAATVFADADVEFGSLPAVAAKLQSFKSQHAAAYRDAYMSLSVPALFAPFVRLELLQWDLLYQPQSTIESHAWYKRLISYGENAGGGYDEGDADADLIPVLVRKLALPIAQHIIERCWTPRNASHTSCVVACLRTLLIYLDPEDESLQQLLKVVVERLNDAIEDVSVPSWSSGTLEAAPHAVMVVAQRVHTVQQLVSSICSCEEVLSAPLIRSMALSRLLFGKCAALLHALDVSPRAVVLSHLTMALPQSWFAGEVPGDAKQLTDLIASSARTLCALRGGLHGAQRRAAQQLLQIASRLHLDSTAQRLQSSLSSS